MKRGPDGNPIEAAGGNVERTALPKKPSAREEEKGQLYRGPDPREIGAMDSDKTRLIRSSGKLQDGADEKGPVVGWVVIIDGPGKGNALELGFGNNRIGRGSDAELSLCFGDEAISRKNHCNIIFDGRSSKFYIQPGESRNLTYLGDDAVLDSQELSTHDKIGLGKTTLLFVQLCGDSFTWED
ncbi:FHA domain-containing protein [Nioella ostreopsis]|uniref:FHA domain-containing protein n=1 Tax=Nioella ostreopsis TaxID=2448479 RepID=UPI000FD9B146|nr:FHA domain-containing protein [Nioella ostreopsis]